MTFLILAVLSSTGVAVVLRLAPPERRLTLFAINYLTGLIVGVAVGLAQGSAFWPSAGELLLSAIVGTLYVVGFLVFSRSILSLGTGVASSVARLSVAIPILVSVLVFRESGTPLQMITIGLAVAVLPLASRDWPPFARRSHRPDSIWLIAAVFVVIGISDSILKVRNELFGDTGPLVFVTFVFAVACVVATALALANSRRRIDAAATVSRNWRSLLLGVPLGLLNFGSAFFMTAALRELDGSVAYAINAVAVILLTSVAGIAFFGERLRAHNYVFLVIAAIAVAILSPGTT